MPIESIFRLRDQFNGSSGSELGLGTSTISLLPSKWRVCMRPSRSSRCMVPGTTSSWKSDIVVVVQKQFSVALGTHGMQERITSGSTTFGCYRSHIEDHLLLRELPHFGSLVLSILLVLLPSLIGVDCTERVKASTC